MQIEYSYIFLHVPHMVLLDISFLDILFNQYESSFTFHNNTLFNDLYYQHKSIV